MTHYILLLRSIVVVVIIWDVGNHYFGLLHHVYCSWHLLLYHGLTLLLGNGYLTILILCHEGVCLLKLLLLVLPKGFDLLMVHLLSCQNLALHLNVVHFLLLI